MEPGALRILGSGMSQAPEMQEDAEWPREEIEDGAE
jgi:hypothetical protein